MMTNQRRAKDLRDLSNLLPSGPAKAPQPWSVERLRSVSELKVRVVAGEHANLDSLPLRFNVHFPADTTINLQRVEFERVDVDFPDRFHFDAWSSFNGDEEQSGHFVLTQQKHSDDLVLVTVWRHDARTELGLSEVMTQLRRDKFLTPSMLRDLHPFYRDGTLRKNSDLVQHLVRVLSASEAARLRAAVAKSAQEAELRAVTAETERDQAREELRIERERFERERVNAQRNGQAASLSTPDTLVEVVPNVLYRGSQCTALVMGDGSKRYMKTATFDRDGSVTAKAKGLRGRRVRISSWDPVAEPGKWSRQGYFRNIYAAE